MEQDRAQAVDRPLGEGSRVDDILLNQKENKCNQDKALRGHAVQIVEIDNEDHSFRLDEEALARIISDERIKDLPVCVVSVAGKLFAQFSMGIFSGANMKGKSKLRG